MSKYPEYSWIESSIYRTLEEAEKNRALAEKLKIREEIPAYLSKKTVKNPVHRVFVELNSKRGLEITGILECILSEN